MLQNLVLTFMRLASLWFFLIHSVIATPNPFQANQLLCDKDIFGTPSAEDCYQAMFWIPYMNPPARDSADAKAPRLFAEPQYLNPPFSAVKNAYAPKAIVQLPKIWKYGMLIRLCSILIGVLIIHLRYLISASASLKLFALF